MKPDQSAHLPSDGMEKLGAMKVIVPPVPESAIGGDAVVRRQTTCRGQESEQHCERGLDAET